jgi:hypothetical protein
VVGLSGTRIARAAEPGVSGTLMIMKTMIHIETLRFRALLVISLILAFSGCARRDEGVYTLYRTLDNEYMRVHVATFDANQVDAAEREKFNSQTCQAVADMFTAELKRGRMGLKVKFWCEKGRFRK